MLCQPKRKGKLAVFNESMATGPFRPLFAQAITEIAEAVAEQDSPGLEPFPA